MNPNSQRVEQVFDEAAALPPGPEREARLAKACRDDAGLREEVESLLIAHEKCGQFLEGAATVKMDDTLPAPPHLAEGRLASVEGKVYSDESDPVPRIPGF